MADLTLSFYSQVLDTQAEVRIILPTPRSGFQSVEKGYYSPLTDSSDSTADPTIDPTAANSPADPTAAGTPSDSTAASAPKSPAYPVLYLFHGATGNHQDWIKQTGILRYAERFGICVVMPAVGNSMYLDMPGGLRYNTFVSQELQALVEETFPVSRKPEDRYIAGLSMGGYGALRVALANPERYAAAVSLSGVVEILAVASEFEDRNSRVRQWFLQALGTDPSFHKQQDLHYLYDEALKQGLRIPPIYLACGTEDSLYPANLHFAETLLAKAAPLKWTSDPGAHTWEYWDKHILLALEWLFPEK